MIIGKYQKMESDVNMKQTVSKYNFKKMCIYFLNLKVQCDFTFKNIKL